MNTILLIKSNLFLVWLSDLNSLLWDWGLHCHPDGKYDGQSALYQIMDSIEK